MRARERGRIWLHQSLHHFGRKKGNSSSSHLSHYHQKSSLLPPTPPTFSFSYSYPITIDCGRGGGSGIRKTMRNRRAWMCVVGVESKLEIVNTQIFLSIWQFRPTDTEFTATRRKTHHHQAFTSSSSSSPCLSTHLWGASFNQRLLLG